MEHFLTIISKVKGFTNGQMGENMMDHGKRTRCKAKEHSLGKTAEYTRVPTPTTKKMATVNSSGLIIEPTKANGKTVNNTEKENISIAKALKEKENGKKEKESSGLMKKKKMKMKKMNDLNV